MNMRFLVRWLSAVIMAVVICPTVAMAQYDLYVEVTKPGTLEELVYDISETAMQDVQSMQVLGHINGKDMMFLREMCGVKGTSTPTEGKLKTLDLSFTSIVGSDDVYITVNGVNYTTHDDEFGPFFLYHCTNLESLELPNEIISIDTMALAACTNLRHVEIPEIVQKIGYGAFVGCDNILRLVVPDEVSEIEVGAFQQMKRLNELVLGDRVREIDNSLILNDDSLEYIYLGVDFEKFNPVVFYTANALKAIHASIGSSIYSSEDGVLFSITGDTLVTFPKASEFVDYKIPDGVKRISPYAFYGADKLKSVTMPENLVCIDSLAFFGCKALENVALNEKLDTIAFGAFGCGWGDEYALNTLKIPASVRCIEGGAFILNSSLENIMIDQENTHYVVGEKGIIYNNDITAVCHVPCFAEDVALPESVTDVGNYAFAGAMNTPFLSIGDNVKRIGDGAFAFATGLRELFLGKGVEKVGDMVVSYCDNLSSLYFFPKNIDDDNIAEYAFLDESGMVMEQCTLFVPEGLSELYLTKKGFYSEEFETFFFADIMEMLNADRIQYVTGKGIEGSEPRYYNANGQQLQSQSKGLNIITMPDGKSMKRFVK